MKIFLTYLDGTTATISAVQWYRPMLEDAMCIIKTYGNDPAINRSILRVEVMEGDYVCMDKTYAERHIV